MRTRWCENQLIHPSRLLRVINIDAAFADLTLVTAGFYKAVWGFAVIILVAAPLFAATDFIGDRLKLEWRRWLTKKILSAYYANRSFYKIHGRDDSTLDNPDQVGPSSLLDHMMRKLSQSSDRY